MQNFCTRRPFLLPSAQGPPVRGRLSANLGLLREGGPACPACRPRFSKRGGKSALLSNLVPLRGQCGAIRAFCGAKGWRKEGGRFWGHGRRPCRQAGLSDAAHGGLDAGNVGLGTGNCGGAVELDDGGDAFSEAYAAGEAGGLRRLVGRAQAKLKYQGKAALLFGQLGEPEEGVAPLSGQRLAQQAALCVLTNQGEAFFLSTQGD